MKILDVKAAVDKEWEKLETIPAWQLDKVKSKKEVNLEAQKDKMKVHFATLMDIVHLKNAKLEPKFQKYKGRVVLRGDVVKDESGANAVFRHTLTAAKVMDVIARLPDCDGQEQTSYQSTLRYKWRMLPDCSEFQSQNSINCHNLGQILKIHGSS